MIAKVLGRLVHVVIVLFLVSLATFFLLELVPGDPAVAILGADSTPEQYAAVRDELGLDHPLPERYADWLGGAMHGDLGKTVVPPVDDVSSLIASRLPVTIELTAMAMAIALAFAVPLAMWSSLRVNSRIDRVTGTIAYGIVSIPSFLGALLLIFFLVFRPQLVADLLLAGGLALGAWLAYRSFGQAARVVEVDRRRTLVVGLAGAASAVVVAVLVHQVWPAFPRQGFVRWDGLSTLLPNLRSLFLPALTLGLIEGAIFLRVLRTDMVTTLQEDYVLAARAKGMPTSHIMVREVLRPSSFSLVTVAGVSLGRLFGGAVIVEAIFRLPGMGSLIVGGVNTKDFAVVQASVLVIALVYVLVNLAVDTSYAYLDPRIRRART